MIDQTTNVTIENGAERDVNPDTDYPCEECSTDTLTVWHERGEV